MQATTNMQATTRKTTATITQARALLRTPAFAKTLSKSLTKSLAKALATALVMTATMLLALPVTAHAATDLATIDIGELGASNADNLGHATESQWSYNGTTRELTLSTIDGNYELTGKNDALSVIVAPAVTGAEVTLRGAHITSPALLNPIVIFNNCTISLSAHNTLTSVDSTAISVSSGTVCTFAGDGTLTATSQSGDAIYLPVNAELLLKEAASVDFVASTSGSGIACGGSNIINVGATARLSATGVASGISAGDLELSTNGVVICTATGAGNPGMNISASKAMSLLAPGTASGMVNAIGGDGGQAISTDQTIVIADRITLTLINNSATAESHSLARVIAPGALVWQLSPASLLTGGTMSSDTIGVTVPANTAGTIYRGSDLAYHLCKNVRTGVGYYSLEAALAAASSGDTVILLSDIIEDPGHALVLTRDVIIDMAGFNLHYFWNIRMLTPLNVSIINGGDLTVSSMDIWGGALAIKADDLILKDNYLGAYLGAEVTVDAGITALTSTAVVAQSDTDVTINGYISAANTGVWAQWGALVKVNGGIEAGENGVFADNGAIVRVTGDIEVGWYGVFAQEENTSVTVTGNIEAGYDGVYTRFNAAVTVTGNVSAVLGGIFADESTVTVIGNVDAGGSLIALYFSSVHVTGNVSLTSQSSYLMTAENSSVTLDSNLAVENLGGDVNYAVFCYDPGSTIMILGNVTSNKNGVVAGDGGEVTIDGTLTIGAGLNYVRLTLDAVHTDLSIAEHTSPTTKSGYLTYTDETSTVWVGDPDRSPDTTPGTGDNSSLALLGSMLLLAILGAGAVVLSRRNGGKCR